MYLIAHRGNDNHKYISNTSQSLLYSLNQDYIDGVELDIRMTKDKKIVIFHNFLINDKNNPLKAVSTLTYNKLKKYDIGNNNHISLLDDFLSKVNNNKKLMIEIKEESNDYKIVVDELMKVIFKYKLNYYICSFNYDLLKYLKKEYSNYKVGLIVGMFMNDNYLENDLDFISVTINYLEKVDYSKEVFIWTINNNKEINQIMKYKKDVGIITDKAYKLIKYLD